MHRSGLRNSRWLVVITGLLAIAGGCLTFPGSGASSISIAPGLRAELIVPDAQSPSALAFTDDGRVFYAERKTGNIRVIEAGVLQSAPVATVPVNYAGERGLLGLALHPDFGENGRIYAFYTRSDSTQSTNRPEAVIDNRVVYFELVGNVASGSEVFVTSLSIGAAPEHIGGHLAFAPDGKLLVAIGDLGDTNNALDRFVNAGKILRFNDDGSIPDDNPFAGAAFYGRGVRDPRSLTIDPVDGTPLFIDRNEPDHEELNRLQAEGNYAWPAVVGIVSTEEEIAYAAANGDVVNPILDTGSAGPQIVGGAVNPSTRYSDAVSNAYFYGEATSRRVVYLKLSDDRTSVVRATAFTNAFPDTPTNVGFTPAGTLYVACENAIYRVVPQ